MLNWASTHWWPFVSVIVPIYFANTMNTGPKGLSVFDSPEYLIEIYIKELKELKSFWSYHRNVCAQFIPLVHNFLFHYRNSSFTSNHKLIFHLYQKIFDIKQNHTMMQSGTHYNLRNAITQKSIKTRQASNSDINSTLHTIDSPYSVIQGAVLGILLLQDTYQIDLDTFLKDTVNNATKQERTKETYYDFNATDFLLFAVKALDLKWYANANAFTNHTKFQRYQKLSHDKLFYPKQLLDKFEIVKEYSDRQLLNSKSAILKLDNLKFLPFSANDG